VAVGDAAGGEAHKAHLKYFSETERLSKKRGHHRKFYRKNLYSNTISRKVQESVERNHYKIKKSTINQEKKLNNSSNRKTCEALIGVTCKSTANRKRAVTLSRQTTDKAHVKNENAALGQSKTVASGPNSGQADATRGKGDMGHGYKGKTDGLKIATGIEPASRTSITLLTAL